MGVKIDDESLPVVYHAADRSSLNSQQRFLRLTKVRLAAILAAACFGLFVWRRGDSPVDWAGVLAAVCFFGAVLVEVYLLAQKPERTWYEGRAAAESVKTLTWRYMMGADPFGRDQAQTQVDRLFLQRIDDVLEVLKELELVADEAMGEQITRAMRTVRAAPLAEKKTIYEESRVCEQQEWYSRKAIWNRKRATQWSVAMLIAEAAGILAAVLKAVGTVEGDLLGFAGAAVAAMTAWLQTKQHRTLATAYGVTALELASVRSRITLQETEADWRAFVSDAEEAFSREHTLWKASRGVRPI